MEIFIIIHSVYVRVICVSMETDQKDKDMHVIKKTGQPTVRSQHEDKMNWFHILCAFCPGYNSSYEIMFHSPFI